MIIGTNLFATALTAAWILPFGDPPLLKGDHRLLGADFHPGILFGSQPLSISTPLARGINSWHEQHVIQFCKKVVKKCNQEQLAKQIMPLLSKETLNNQDIIELKSIDAALTRILVKEDQRCRPLSILPWSPALQQAYLLHRYWIIHRTAKHLDVDFNDILKQLEACLNPKLIDKDNTKPLSMKLRHVQKALHKAKHKMDQLRQQHLE